MLAVLVALLPDAALAGDKSEGTLLFLGQTANSRSVWLSLTRAGSFELQAPGNLTVDQWLKERGGLRVTLSPNVSSGSAGAHSLIGLTGGPHVIDTQFQTGGIAFPSRLQLPDTLSLDGIKSMVSTAAKQARMNRDGGHGDGDSGHHGEGDSGHHGEGDSGHHGGGDQGNQGGGDSGHHQGGGNSGQGGGNQGGGNQGGGNQGGGNQGGGTPPTGLMPTVPGGVSPPAGTLAPSAVAQSSMDARQIERATPRLVCRDAASDPAATATGGVQLVDCTDPQQRAAVEAQEGFGRTVALTPGREFAVQPLWNAWADTRYADSTDRRYGLDTKGRGTYLTLGADRRMNDDLVAGVSVSFEDNRSNGFEGSMATTSKGYSISPYIGIGLSPNWSLNASLAVGRIENDNRIDILSGSYVTWRYSTALTATGQYGLGETQMRPKLSVSYTHSRNDSYDMSGNVAAIPIASSVAADRSNYGVAGASVEVNRVVRLSGGTVVVPYVEAGVNYEFERPNGGQILTGDLTSATPSAWSGWLRAGARALVSRSTFVELGAGYLSAGQNGLNLWEGKVFLSHAF